VIRIKENQPSAAALMKRLEKNRAVFLENLNDSNLRFTKGIFLKQLAATDSDIALLKRDTLAKAQLKSISDNFTILGSARKEYRNEQSYDSAQQALPAAKRDNFIERRFMRQKIHLDEKYNHDGKAIISAILTKFKHLFPQILFASLPLFALALQLLYVRKKNFFYVNHVVFTIHLYCGTFIIILVGLGVDYLLHSVNYAGGMDGGVFTLAGFFFWYKSMRNFYEQRRAKTILKYVLVMFLATMIMTLLFTVFFIFSAMSI
jgi:hypothetical protein